MWLSSFSKAIEHIMKSIIASVFLAWGLVAVAFGEQTSALAKTSLSAASGETLPAIGGTNRPSRSDSRISTAGNAEARNPYLKNVDAAISDEAVRKAIGRVQPACVRLENASGVNLTSDGYI